MKLVITLSTDVADKAEAEAKTDQVKQLLAGHPEVRMKAETIDGISTQ